MNKRLNEEGDGVGYILPIGDYQAQQHHFQMIQQERKDTSIKIDQLHKPSLNLRNAASENTNESKRSYDKELMSEKSSSHERAPMKSAERVYTEITGIGQKINTYV